MHGIDVAITETIEFIQDNLDNRPDWAEALMVLQAKADLGGATLNPNEVMAAVHDVALAADRYDDQIVAQYGGRRMQDVIEESAWARLLKKAGDEPPHPHLDEEAGKKTPSSGGKKKGS